MRRFAIAALAGLFLPAVPVAAAGEQPDDMVRIVLKFVKRGSPAVPVARFDPASCPACAPVTTPLFNVDNARETVIALLVPRRRSLELAFDGPKDGVRRIILSGGAVPFRPASKGVVVQLPPVAADAVTAAEVATHIVEPGMVLRFEHADPARRAGAYATGPFPYVQRRAADTLEFAQREVIRDLGLGEEVERKRLGQIQVMGFDTNAPHGHVDAPPHVHMHLRWPGDTGTQIGHFYIGSDGLLTHNVIGVKGLNAPDRRLGRGEAFTTVGPDGEGVYTHRITQEGWLEIGRPGQAPCRIRPVGDGGFQAGAWVACPGGAAKRVVVDDAIEEGRLTIGIDDIVETYRYAPDTGALLSPMAAVSPPPSVYRTATAAR